MDMSDTRGHECDDTLSGTLGFEAIGGKRKRESEKAKDESRIDG